MEIKVPKMGEKKTQKEEKKNKILTPEYVWQLNRGIAERIRQQEATHVERDSALTRKIVR